MTGMQPCEGGCGKVFPNDHPNAKVTCLPCAMAATKEIRDKVQADPKTKN